jgi:LPXTG-motif cell wall-anchored protein
MPLITSPARGRRLSTSLTVLGAIMMFSSVGIAKATPVGTVIDYEQTVSAVVPQGSFGGATGGDGWALAFTDSNVYNIFHHDLLRFACRSKTTGVACSGNGYSAAGTKDVSDGTNRFQVAMGPPIYIDKTANRLFTMAVRGTVGSATGTSGVVEIDLASTSANPFVAFYPLSRVGEGACYLDNCGANRISTLSNATKIGTKWYVYNYKSGVDNPSLPDSRNKLLCFDFATKSACVNQPYNVTTSGAVQGRLWEPPTIAAVGNRIFINIYGTTDTNSLAGISCVDVSSTPTNCTGWPIVPNTQFTPNTFTAAPAFPLLNSTGNAIGVCFPGTTANACTDFAGLTITNTAVVTSALAGLASPFDVAWATTRGEAYVDGTRMFMPNVVLANGTSQVECYDFAANNLCTSFSPNPKTFVLSELESVYTLQIDPADPSCLWAMGHGGSKQIQNFDSQTGGACGANGFVLPISNFRESTSRCAATAWKQFALVNPTVGNFTSGTVEFVDSNGSAISGLSAQNFGASGTLDLTSLNLHSYPSFARMHVRLVGTVTREINVKMTWASEYHPECVVSGQTAFTSLGSSAGSAAPSPLIANTTTSVPSTTSAPTTPAAPVALAELPSTGSNGSSTAAWVMVVAGALMIVMGQRRRTTQR